MATFNYHVARQTCDPSLNSLIYKGVKERYLLNICWTSKRVCTCACVCECVHTLRRVLTPLSSVFVYKFCVLIKEEITCSSDVLS